VDLNQVTLPAIDIEESKRFYRAMGFTQIVDSPHYARFECSSGDSTFSLLQVDDPHQFRATPYGVTVYFEDPDVDAVYDRLAGNGFAFEHPPRDERYLWRETRLRDPSGNAIIIYWAGESRKYPPWRLDRSSDP
jgi:catechol 2,3-dioxygenase-like lactoylglutathione lyase family enzyme